MESKKRKREDNTDRAETAIVTFHAPNGRTFSRVFKDKSLAATQETVRKKLALGPDVKFDLAQLRNGTRVDLEDEDDFLAFRTLARSSATLDVQVTIPSAAWKAIRPQEDTLHRSPSASELNANQQPVSTSIQQPKATQADALVTRQSPSEVQENNTEGTSEKNDLAVQSAPKKKPKKPKKTQDVRGVSSEHSMQKSTPGDQITSAESPAQSAEHEYHVLEAMNLVLARYLARPASEDVSRGESVSQDRPSKTKKRKLSTPRASEQPFASSSRLSPTVSTEEPSRKKVRWGSAVPASASNTTLKSKVGEEQRAAQSDDGSVEVPAASKKKKKKVRHTSEVPNTAALTTAASTPEPDTALPASLVKQKKMKGTRQDVVLSPPPDHATITSESVATTEAVPPAPRRKKAQMISPEDTQVESPAADLVMPPSVTKGKGKAKSTPNDASVNAISPSKPAKSSKKTEKYSYDTQRIAEVSTPAREATKRIVATLQERKPSPQPAVAQSSAPTKAGSSSLVQNPLPPIASFSEPEAILESETSHSSPSPVLSPAVLSPPPPTVRTRKGKEVATELSDTNNHIRPSSPPTAAPAVRSRAGNNRAQSVHCPLCLKAPLHLRYKCPVVLAGSASLKRRMNELNRDPCNATLLQQLGVMLTSLQEKEALNASTADMSDDKHDDSHDDSDVGNGSLFATRSPSPEIPLPIPALPEGSVISEVTVQGKGDDSSSDSSSSDEDEDEVEVAHTVPPHPNPMSGLPLRTPPTEADIEALLRGPSSSFKAASVVDKIFANADSDSEVSEVGDMASEEEAKNEKAFRRLSQQLRRTVPSSGEDDSDEEDKPAMDDQVPDSDSKEPESEVPSADSMESVAKDASARKLSEIYNRPAGSAEKPNVMDAQLGVRQNEAETMVPQPDSKDAVNPGNEEASSASSSSSGAEVPLAAVLHEADAGHDPANVDIGKEDAQLKNSVTAPATSSTSIPPNRQSTSEVPLATEHLDDPIEPSEEPTPAADDDPIEPDVPEQTSAHLFTPPPVPGTAPGLTKKMKDRNGEISSTNITQIASQIFQQHAAGLDNEGDDAIAVPEPPSETSKKRGRPRLSMEVRQLRAKEAAEKKAQRDAAREEKARQKAAEKELKDHLKAAGRPTRVSKASTDLIKPAPILQPGDEAAPAIGVQDVSTSRWKTLSMSPSVGEVVEMTMVDELQPSSPREIDGDEAKGITSAARSEPPAPLIGVASPSVASQKSPTLLATPAIKTPGTTSATPLPPAASQTSTQKASQPLYNGESSLATNQAALAQNNSATKRPISVLGRSLQPRFPRLSDIVRQNMATIPLSALGIPPRPAEIKKVMTVFGNDDSSSSSSSEDSDGEPVSHIPKERRAGVQKK